jgi:glucose dehydrogenase
MKKTLSNTSIRAIALSLLFLFSGIGASILINPVSATANSAAPSAVAPVAAATPLTQAQANWEFPNGNAWNQDYNPQNQINASNAQYLGLNWIFPLPNVPTSLSPLLGGIGGVGIGMAIIIVNGTAFLTTQFDETIAVNVANGNVLWTFFTPLAPNQTQGEATGPVPLHSHDGNEWFTTASFAAGPVSGPTLWWQGQNNHVYAINAISGKEVLNFSDFTGLSMVAGNSPQSIYNGIGASNIVINQQLGILVSGHDAEIDADNGRGFFAGWNLNVNPPTMKWITYDTPPQPGSNQPLNPYFDQQLIANISQSAGTFYPGQFGSTNGYTTASELAGGVQVNTNNSLVVNWKTMSPTLLNTTLYNDWGQSDQTAQCLAIDGGGSTGSTGSGWGGAWLLGSGQSAGLVYVPTNNKDPFTGPCDPGTDLWSASIIALNVTTGAWVWALQTTSHDIWDYDCSWWQGMANETINGVNTEVVLKTCKDGYLFEINALTGNLIWAWNPPSNIVVPGPSRCNICYPFNPLNSTMMNADFPSAILDCKATPTIACLRGPQQPFLQYPSELAGFEDEQSYDSATNMIYAVSHIVPSYMGYFGLNSSTYFSSTGEGGVPCPTCGTLYDNATIWAINAGTGQIAWHYNIPLQGYRGGVVISGGLVLADLSSGDILMVNAVTGQLVRDYYIGAPMDQLVSVGSSVQGQESFIVPVGTCSFEAISTCPGTTPGDVVALTLQNVPPPTSVSGSTTTVTSTTTTTSVTTTTIPGQTITTTTTLGNGQVVTTTITGAASTVTLSGSGGVTTTTTTTTGGVSSTALYGVAAVAVIFIIATGYLAMRGRKPAS